MPLEAATYIADLVTTNPLATDQVGQGDDHLRLIKQVLQNSLPNLGGRFGRVQQLTGGYTVLSSDNTAVLEIPTAAAGTTTHTISLPALSSITAGFHFDLFSTSLTHVGLFVPSGGATIEGATSLANGPLTWSRVIYNGTNWRVARFPIASGSGDGFSFPSTLSVSGGTHLKTTLSVGGATTLGSTLTVSGAAVFAAGLTSSGTVLNGGNTVDLLTVTNAATFQAGVHFDGVITMSSAVTMNSTLSVSGAAHMKTTLSVGGATSLASTLSVSGAAHCNTTLSVGGAVSMASTLSVSGASHFNTTVSVGGGATLGSTLTVSGAASFMDVVSISGAVHIKGALSVSGGATLAGTTTISGTCVLTSGQLVFPATANPSGNANTLDDYEEGTWTPALNFGGATTGITYTTQSGVYNKTGGLVWTQFTIVLTSKGTATGSATITGYPFTNNVQSVTVGVMGGNANMAGLTSPVNGTITTTTVSLFDHGATGQTALDDTNFANNSAFRFTLTYGATA